MSHPVPLQPDVIGYTRVSTEDQAGERKVSLEQQRQAITELALKLGRRLDPAMIFEDAGVSGGSERRPAFEALRRYCETNPRVASAPGYVVVLNDSRWGRFSSMDDAGGWRWILKRQGWIVRFVEADATEDPMAREIIRTIYASQATAYREALRMTARRGTRGSAAKGLWLNEAPLGYRRCASRAGEPGRILEPGQRKAHDEETRLVPGPEAEVKLVRELFTRYAAGTVALSQLAREMRVLWPGKRRWNVSTVGFVLKNPAYVGDVVWCRKRNLDHGLQEPTPASEWVVVYDAHPAIIDRDTFDQVQTVLQRNRRQRRATSGKYPLSGLITCAQCGGHYVGGGGALGRPEDPDRYRFYRCSGGDTTDPNAPCAPPLGTLQKRFIEPKVIAAVAGVVRLPEVQRLIAQALDQRLDPEQHRDRQRELGAERRQLEVERERLIASIAGGLLQDAEARPHLERLRAALVANAAAAERERFATRRTAVSTSERGRLLGLLGDFAGIARRASGEQLRELLRPWLASAVFDKAKRKLVLQIRAVPAMAPFIGLDSRRAPTAHQDKDRTYRRVITLPRHISRRRSA